MTSIKAAHPQIRPYYIVINAPARAVVRALLDVLYALHIPHAARFALQLQSLLRGADPLIDNARVGCEAHRGHTGTPPLAASSTDFSSINNSLSRGFVTRGEGGRC